MYGISLTVWLNDEWQEVRIHSDPELEFFLNGEKLNIDEERCGTIDDGEFRPLERI